MTAERIQLVLDHIAAALPAIGTGLAVIVFSWLAALLARRGVAQFAQRIGQQARADVLNLVGSIVFWTAIGIGVVTGLGTMGIRVEPLVASLGLTGFALGFALRDAISNLLSGVLILTYRPFRHGDRIAVTGFEGVVIHIDLRYTTPADGEKIHLIPNQTMHTNPVTVLPAAPPPAAPND